ncbi:DUF3954 domain-containing protein [Evansella tamaricis]|uniref:DUF3954 domain-containing protein n=1 Tax=Evansella tamaricis TaxID=2069301 RepID=A0ABS6JE01_9BACI|nr:DUF3954 domain-containing protein [Evansella tamaricis]MBU9711082.1 DUF3954 domain-containing protein [Evansella tamaricis]
MEDNQNKENCIYIVKDGVKTKFEAPVGGHGEYKLIWQDGKILDVVKSERVRI